MLTIEDFEDWVQNGGRTHLLTPEMSNTVCLNCGEIFREHIGMTCYRNRRGRFTIGFNFKNIEKNNVSEIIKVLGELLNEDNKSK